MLISFIIPVYNTENYLEMLLRSLVESEFSDYEIICVDDGSTDRSLDILRAFQKNCPAMSVLEKENGGASSARNFGIAYAKGKYICFLDSDDQILPNEKIHTLLHILQTEDYDWVLSDVRSGKNSGQATEYDRAGLVDLCCRTDLLHALHAKFYKADIIRTTGILFDSAMRVGEDNNFNIRFCRFAKKALWLDFRFYKINQNPQSLSHTFKMDFFESAQKNYAAKNDLIKSLGDSALFREVAKMHINRIAFCLLKLYRFDPKECKRSIKPICQREDVLDALEKVKMRDFRLKYKILYYIVNRRSFAALKLLAVTGRG